MNLYPIEVNSDTSVTLEYDNYIIDASANNVTMTLPDMTGIGFGKSIIFSRVDQSNFTVTIVATATTIDGVASVIIPALGFRQIVYDNNDWHTIQGVGYSGYSGYSGISGYSGFSGISGYSGFSGISGYSGFSGASGYSGYSGVTPSPIWTDYSATSTIIGFSSFTTKVISYAIVGKIFTVRFLLIGNGNSTSVSFTIPNTTATNGNQYGSMVFIEDNGVNLSTVGGYFITANTSTISLFPNSAPLSVSWSAGTGIRQVGGTIVLEIQ